MDELEPEGIPGRTKVALALLGTVGTLVPLVMTVLLAAGVIGWNGLPGIREGYLAMFLVSALLCATILIGSSPRAAGLYLVGVAAMTVTVLYQSRSMIEGKGPDLGYYWLLAPLVAGFSAAFIAANVSSIGEALDDAEGRPVLAKASVAIVVAGIAASVFWQAPLPERLLVELAAAVVSAVLAVLAWPNRTARVAWMLSVLVIAHLFYVAMYML